MISYRRQNLSLGVKYSLNREIARNAQIFVKPGQEVEPETLVAQGKEDLGFRRVNLAQEMSLPPEKLAGALRKMPGSRVYLGDVLARVTTTWGLRQVEYRSPVDGVLQYFDADSGILTLGHLPRISNVAAGMRGRVSRIVPGKKILIESLIDCVQGVLGLGRAREGILARVGRADLPLKPEQLSQVHQRKIVFGGSRAPLAFFHRALELGVAGVILGGIDLAVLRKLSSQRGRFEDVGFTLVATEGYGNLAIEPKLFDYLKAAEGKYGFLFGYTAELLLPTSAPSPSLRKGVTPSNSGREFAVLKAGQYVRILVGEEMGRYGIVVDVGEDSCTVDIGGDSVSARVRNVEILETGR